MASISIVCQKLSGKENMGGGHFGSLCSIPLLSCLLPGDCAGPQTPMVEFSVDVYSVGEDAGFVEIVLTIFPATEFLRSVLFSTVDGTATGKRALLGGEVSQSSRLGNC